MLMFCLVQSIDSLSLELLGLKNVVRLMIDNDLVGFFLFEIHISILCIVVSEDDRMVKESKHVEFTSLLVDVVSSRDNED